MSEKLPTEIEEAIRAFGRALEQEQRSPSTGWDILTGVRLAAVADTRDALRLAITRALDQREAETIERCARFVDDFMVGIDESADWACRNIAKELRSLLPKEKP